MPIEQIPGAHGGIVFHDGRGHIFRRQRDFRGITYMVCATSTCPGRGNMLPYGDTIEETKPHNHDPDFDLPKALIWRKRILERCRLERGSPRQIYRDEIAKAGHLASHEVLCSMFSSLQRARSSASLPRPPVPENLIHYRKLVNKPEYSRFARTLAGEPWLLDVVSSGHGDLSVIFMSPFAKQLLKECEEFHLECTSDLVPQSSSCYQLTTITAMQEDNGFIAVLALMSKCSRMAYVTILRRILEEEPEWLPGVIIADFEFILQSALDEVFGTTGLTSILGCWYRYTQALWKEVQTLPALPEGSICLQAAKMAMGLPVLPSSIMSSGVTEIVAFLLDNLEGEELDWMLEFMHYVDKNWIEKYGGERLSVNDLDYKLNYDIETLHHRIAVYVTNTKKGALPGFWDFMAGLQKLENDQSKMAETLLVKGKISKPRKKRHYYTQNKIMRDVSVKLKSGMITMREFLTAISQRVYRACSVNGKLNQMDQHNGETEQEEQEDEEEQTTSIVDDILINCDEFKGLEDGYFVHDEDLSHMQEIGEEDMKHVFEEYSNQETEQEYNGQELQQDARELNEESDEELVEDTLERALPIDGDLENVEINPTCDEFEELNEVYFVQEEGDEYYKQEINEEDIKEEYNNQVADEQESNRKDVQHDERELNEESDEELVEEDFERPLSVDGNSENIKIIPTFKGDSTVDQETYYVLVIENN